MVYLETASATTLSLPVYTVSAKISIFVALLKTYLWTLSVDFKNKDAYDFEIF